MIKKHVYHFRFNYLLYLLLNLDKNLLFTKKLKYIYLFSLVEICPKQKLLYFILQINFLIICCSHKPGIQNFYVNIYSN